jgi:hypothetical protein
MKKREIKEILNAVENLLNDLPAIDEEFTKTLEEASKLPVKITLERKEGEYTVHTEVSGNGLSILTALASLEKNILKKLKCNESTFELLKAIVSTEEA